MGIYVKIFFGSLIAAFLLAVILAIVEHWAWIFFWPASWVLLGFGACVDLSVGNVDEEE